MRTNNFLTIVVDKNKKLQYSQMHVLQPKHTKMNEKEVEELLEKLNLSKSQLPKILSDDAALPEGCQIGDVIKIERDDATTGETVTFYRVVV